MISIYGRANNSVSGCCYAMFSSSLTQATIPKPRIFQNLIVMISRPDLCLAVCAAKVKNLTGHLGDLVMLTEFHKYQHRSIRSKAFNFGSQHEK